MLFAHLKRILRLGRLRLRGPCGPQFEFTLAAIAQNLRRLAKLVARPPVRPFVRCVSVASVSKVERNRRTIQRVTMDGFKNAPAVPRRRYADFCNKIGTKRTTSNVRYPVANGGKADMGWIAYFGSD